MQRFWDKVDKSGTCWIWTGTPSSVYGRFALGGKLRQAHRMAYILTFGEIPEGAMVMHKCDVPRCVNPYHLMIGTPADNMRDKVRKNRQYRGEGHNKTPFIEEEIRRIREQALFGARHIDIAKICGVSLQAIRAIVLRKAWKHVL